MPFLSKRFPATRVIRSLAAAATVFAAACSSDSITTPAAPRGPNFEQSAYRSIKAPIGGVVKLLYPMDALTRDVPLAQPITQSFTFDKRGGRIEIRETGLRVDVPSGAIPGNSLTITVTAIPGDAIAYDFQPHGTVFLKPLKFQQELKATSWEHADFRGTVLGGYFEDEEQLRILPGLTLLDELYPVLIDSKRATFDIKHFSGYMVSGGRQKSYEYAEF
ncbi:MAG: hypothetical protein ACO1Q7_15410 [Gemmatimonas sp.]